MKEDPTNHPRPAWYILHAYPGFEQRAKSNLEKRLQAKGIASGAFLILIPSEEEDGNKPALLGILLLRMQMDAEAWSVARNTPGVTGFVGMGNTPTPFYQEHWSEIPLQRFAN